LSAAFSIAPAARAQLPEILGIYNEVIRNTTAVYSDQEVTLANREAWFDARVQRGFPVLVATDPSGGVLGFASFGEFRAWPCYRYSVEHSVHVRADSRGRGVGRTLVTALLERAAGMKMHVMIGGIDADNVTSLALHDSLGFKVVGHFREVGCKFGRWLDLKFLQRLI
jgi:L-amino acid N-acyltransferase YncA